MMDLHDGASVRNLEHIQEDRPGEGGRAWTLGILVMGGACVLFAAFVLGGRKSAAHVGKKTDPLAELAAKAPGSPTVLPGEVTFPNILSDKPHPATALAAAGAGNAPAMVAPPPGDKLPVVPLPARHALTPSAFLAPPVAGSTSNKPKDKLTTYAEGATDPSSIGGATLASSGSEGGWQVQVSSFKTQVEADAFATQLRARGHKAHVQKAEIPKRGTWYRVKVGPFSTQVEAIKYRQAFEAKEKMPGFVVKSGELH
ncbi:MAG: SPOR domain-containing protein [Myxococcales bacterium]|nr:SPOR domain-containing protein [Myxococcales bacterium]